MEIINQPIENLDLSKGFCNQSELMGFKTLNDIISLTPKEILSKTEFTYHWLEQLTQFLKENQLLHLLQPIPGKKYD